MDQKFENSYVNQPKEQKSGEVKFYSLVYKQKFNEEVINQKFKSISNQASGELLKSFAKKQVKKVVRECDTYENLGSDGINFGFLKDIWS